MTSSAAPSEETSARGITLRRDVRAGAAAQLRCLGGAVCGTTAEPDSMLCRRTRADSMDSVASSFDLTEGSVLDSFVFFMRRSEHAQSEQSDHLLIIVVIASFF